MKRTTASFRVNDIHTFKEQMLNWANRFNIFLLLDSHSCHDKYSKEEWMLAAGAADAFTPPEKNVLEALGNFLSAQNDWLFGHISYDLKDHIHSLRSTHTDHIGFPEIFFFLPEILIRKAGDSVEIASLTTDPALVFEAITSEETVIPSPQQQVNIRQRIPREEYLQLIHKLQQHILRGDCYEINFCQEFFAENAGVDPASLYRKLSAVSPTPFGGFYKLHDKYLICASPERFLQKNGRRIISQPIKGTIHRSPDAAADEILKQELLHSRKDRSENVMIVDLMRNDLSRICEPGSVHVEELFGIYSFPQVHQMISTVAAELNKDADLPAILEATFPMGSMTGAPKRRVMELTEQYERSRRGIYSGSIGYITPEKDFDFNVVIRSIMYNAGSRYLSYQVGGGITFYSDPEKEYEECLVKATAIKKVLG